MVFDAAVGGAVIVRHMRGSFRMALGETPLGLSLSKPHHFICTVPFTVTVTLPLPGSTASASSLLADIAEARA